MTGNTTSRTCNAVIDLTGDSDDERIESSRNNSGNLRRRQNRTSDDIVVTEATIQSSCPVCLKKFTTIKAAGGYFCVTKCGHLFCVACINMIIKLRRWTAKYIHCPTCRKSVYKGQLQRVSL